MLIKEMKVEVVSRQIIKPSSPTPPHFRCFKLSCFDQFNPLMYYSVVLFYTNNQSANVAFLDGNSVIEQIASKKSQHLKQSLSQVLTRFYPFAGRIIDNLSVDCNDEGVEYLEARVDCPLSNLLEYPTIEELKQFTPIGQQMKTNKDTLLVVQASFFECGGMALGIKVCHKVADAITLGTIIKGWATTALGSPTAVVPDFSAATRFPPIDSCVESPFMTEVFLSEKGITRRIVFEASKIEALKFKAASIDVEHPTRVEVVVALLFKCALSASTRSILGSPRASALVGAINARASLLPPLPAFCCGNILGSLEVVVNDGKIELSKGVCFLRKAKYECQNLWLNLRNAPLTSVMNNLPSVENNYVFSSWCRIPFYEADFGWGKPIWVSYGSEHPNRGIFLMDTREGDGIEAWVKLPQEEMALFECDEDLIAFGSLSPSATPN